MEDSSITTMSFNPNKHLKEQFVSNLTGSSMLEIFLLALVVPIVVLLRRAIGFNYVSDFSVSQRLLKKDDNVSATANNASAYMVSAALDFSVMAVPALLMFTVLSDWLYKLTLWMPLTLLLCILLKRYFFSSPGSLQPRDSIRNAISSFRVSTMFVACVCILAVDFNIFPRKYAKTETYGTGWMDLGVGSFVVTNALVSRQARNLHVGGWKTALQSTCPLILLGLARLVSTTGVDYQVHVGEYGVHWNFFFTLASVSLLTSSINFHPRYCGILGLFILIGYLGMYLVGVHMGYQLFFKNNYIASSDRDKWTRKGVYALCVLFWLLTLYLNEHVEQVSRRMCNMAYVMLVFAVNLEVLSMYLLSEFIPGKNFTVLEDAFNQNLLSMFLLANLLTGLVNLSIDTIFVSSYQALAILVVYVFVLCFSAGLAHFFGIRLKFRR